MKDGNCTARVDHRKDDLLELASRRLADDKTPEASERKAHLRHLLAQREYFALTLPLIPTDTVVEVVVESLAEYADAVESLLSNTFVSSQKAADFARDEVSLLNSYRHSTSDNHSYVVFGMQKHPWFRQISVLAASNPT